MKVPGIFQRAPSMSVHHIKMNNDVKPLFTIPWLRESNKR